MNCAQFNEFERQMNDKDDENAMLKLKIEFATRDSSRARRMPPLNGETRLPDSLGELPRASTIIPEEPSLSVRSSSSPLKRRGKAPPLDSFSGEDDAVRLDDWLPGLKRVSQWYDWSEEEHLIQLAGYLRGKALQEWELIDASMKTSLSKAVGALKSRLDPSSKTMAAQDFLHTVHQENEPVSAYIRRLERTYRVAYGRDGMSTETRAALLYGQLHVGLRYEVMKSPAVSGAKSYTALRLAAKSEEQRL